MIETLVFVASMAFVVPQIAKGFYRGIAVFVADHILHESLICTEEIRKPYDCQTQAVSDLKSILPWHKDVTVAIQMVNREYMGHLNIIFDHKHSYNKKMTVDMDRFR